MAVHVDDEALRLGVESQGERLIFQKVLKKFPEQKTARGDTIGVRPQSLKSKIFDGIKERLAGSTAELPAWLTFDLETLTAKIVALPKAMDAAPLFDPKQIIELYSR